MTSVTPVAIPVPGPAELRLSTTSGHIEVIGEDREDVVIESGAPSDRDIESDATGRVSLTSARGGSANLVVRCPTGSDLVAGTVSGHVTLRGQLGNARVTTISGNIEVQRADALDVRSISGNIEVERCAGVCSLRTKSGRTTIGSAGDTEVSTISGRITLEDAKGGVKMRSVSGTVELSTEGKGDVAVQTMSGSVRVAVAHGVKPSPRLRSLSGKPRFECPEGSDCRINVNTLSGRIEVVPD
jgi:DUF4097 and DUF4098 domain-containing protein YvlB